jgi:hypothetical protein|tara:strand:+ start:194 stop:361 length:168 start_codon:yes stop_codon:yes gene_type:complete
MKAKINDEVKFKASSLSDGKVVAVPDEDTNMYTIEFENGNTIKCTEQYFEVKVDG